MPSNRPELPRRSYWPRFKLSTFLVLVAIVAWAMACRPWWLSGEDSRRYFTPEEYREYRLHENPPDDEFPGIVTGVPIMLYLDKPGLNPRLTWPAVALAVFLVWKFAWSIAARRKQPCEASAT